MKTAIVYLVATLALVHSAKYDGYKTFKVQPIGKEALDLLNFPGVKDIEFLTPVNVVGKSINILASPQSQNNLISYLKQHQFSFSIEVEDVEEVLQQEQKLRNSRKSLKAGEVAFDRYLTYEEINSYLERLVQDYPNLVSVESIGQSFEGRETNAIRISSGSWDSKPTLLIDAGIHAREWVTPAFTLYIINQLVENPEFQYLVDKVNWIILPTINPDGYVFSWQQDERFWRKTRTPGKQCAGVDENRNFGYQWSDEPEYQEECYDTYSGTGPWSSIEAQNFRDYVLQQANIPFYLSLHSCGQYLLYPWGYTGSIIPDNRDEVEQLAYKVNDAIKAVRGTEYEIGSPPEILYEAAGNTMDWAVAEAKIPVTHALELPCGGFMGFDLPEEQILGVVIETFEAIKVYHDFVVENYS